MMQLELKRFYFGTACTIGLLFVDGVFECFTLEPPREFGGARNVPDKTCILPGSYQVQVEMSPKHLHRVPCVLDVPGRSDIEMHIGNTAADTEGCILVAGSAFPLDSAVRSSANAFWALMLKFPADGKAELLVRE